MNRKTICLVTNWYPTADNPYAGIFFKEQAFAMEQSYDFVVLHFHENRKLASRDAYAVRKINAERNTTEYSVEMNFPIAVFGTDLFSNFKRRHIDKNTIQGVGNYASALRRKRFAQFAERFAEESFMSAVDAFYCVDAQTEAGLVKYLADACGKPYVVGEHAPVPWPGSVLGDINVEAIEGANLFLAISNDKIRQLLLQNIKLPRIQYIGNLVDESALKYKPRKERKTKTILIVAANSFFKNYDMFIQVMNRLTEITDVKYKVKIVGYASNAGYSGDRQAFERKIAESKFVDRVELVPEVAHADIADVYNSADVFVMTSIQEGQPVSALEAACCGLPIYSTRCGGVEDYVDDSVGRLYSVIDVEGMAQGLREFVEGSVQYDRAAIRDKIVERFGQAAFTANFASAFESVIESK